MMKSEKTKRRVDASRIPDSVLKRVLPEKIVDEIRLQKKYLEQNPNLEPGDIVVERAF